MAPINTELPAWVKDWFDPGTGWLIPSRYKIAYGGRGSAKSWTFAELLLLAGKREKHRILCAREYQANIKGSVHKLLSDRISSLSLDFFYRITKEGIIGNNGTEFLFAGIANDPRKIKSTEGITICWVEEADSVSEVSWEFLTPTIRASGSEIWITFNPNYLDDPTCKRFYGDKAPDDALVKEVNHDSNPWFTDEMQKEMASDYERDPDRAEHIWGGKPVSFSKAQVLHGKWAVKEFTSKPGWDGPYFGVDWGFSVDPLAVVKFWLDADVLYIEHEAYGAGVEVQDTPAFIRSIPGVSSHVLRADSARPEMVSHCCNSGLNMLSAEKWHGSVEDGVTWLRGLAGIVIHPRCINAIKDAGHWKYKADKSGNILPKLMDGNDHTFDAVRYGAEKLIKGSGKTVKMSFASAGRRKF